MTIRTTSEILDRTPPHDQRAEQSVIGCLLLDPRRVDEVASRLRPDDFYVDVNRRLWRHLLAMHDARAAIDTVTLTARLKAAGELDAIGGLSYLHELLNSVAIPQHAAYYADLVRTAAGKRRLVQTGIGLVQAGYDPGVELPEAVAGAETELAEISTGEFDSGPVSAHDAAAEFLEHLDAIRDRRKTAGLRTGFEQYDSAIGGFFPGELVILAARPSQGKTALALQVAYYAASRGRPTMVVSLEMSRRELISRLACALSGVDSRRVRTGDVSDQDAAKLLEATNRIAALPLSILDRPAVTANDIRRIARQTKRKGLDLLVVDYLQLVRPADQRVNREQQVASMSRDMKALAQELDIPVIVACQLSRASEQSEEPQLHHLRESGAIEQDADVVAFLQRGVKWSDAEPVEPSQAKLTLRKNRNGPLASVRLRWCASRTWFETPTTPTFSEFDQFGRAGDDF